MKNGPNILWNAEAFGFGPAAAIAKIAGCARERTHRSVYLGSEHTLELQTRDLYDEIVDVDGVGDVDLWLREAASEYDVFVTAMDFALAERARAAGLRVIVYDALAWYWPHAHTVLADLYLVGDFIGVKERLADLTLPPTIIVPPLVTLGESNFKIKGNKTSSKIVVSFGGISNPVWDEAAADVYALMMARALSTIPVEIIGSRRYASLCESAGIRSYCTVTPSESEHLFKTADVIVATPGLGNLYEAAAADKPFLALPPANDSQGRQMRLLAERGYLPAALDWHEFLPSSPIDYSQKQTSVLEDIAHACHCLQKSPTAQAALANELARRFAAAVSLRPFLEDYGDDGARECADHVLAFADAAASAKTPAPGVAFALAARERELLEDYGYQTQGSWELTPQAHGFATTSLIDENGEEVTAVRAPELRCQFVTPEDIVALRAAGFTHFVHTTRPENLLALLEAGTIFPAVQMQKKVLYGDRLGPHSHVLGHLLTHSDVDALREVTGGRTPALLLGLEALVGTTAFVNGGHFNAQKVAFSTTDGVFTPSQPLSEAPAVLTEQVRRDNHEIVLNAALALTTLEFVVIDRELADVLDEEKLRSFLKQSESTLVWVDAILIPAFLAPYRGYSANSLAVVARACRRNLNDRQLRQLLAREIPELLTADISFVRENLFD